MEAMTAEQRRAERREVAQFLKTAVELKLMPRDYPIVRLLVREKSGAWWVDESYMLRSRADEQRRQWNRLGYGCLILKHCRNVGLKIVQRGAMRWGG